MKRMLPVICAALTLPLVFSSAAWAKDYEKAREYFSEYFNIQFEDPDSTTINDINNILVALDAEPVDTEAEVDACALVAEGIRIAGLEELALTYIHDDVPDKAQKKLEEAADFLAEYDVEVTDEYAPYLACALDMELIGPEGEQDAVDFLYRCAEIGGRARHFLGRISDEDILSVAASNLGTYINFEMPDLTALGNEVILSGATTGFSLKYDGYDADFLADYTICYGHSELRHAVQLIGLLKSEGIDAYVQLEPKVSAYEYLTEWGDPGEPTPTYEVKQVTDDRYICYASEYDMKLEFDTKEEKEAFHGIIETYAKKYDDSVDEEGEVVEKLLAGSFWQPLYYSMTEMENEEYGELVDNIVYDENGHFSIHSFSLPDKIGEIAEIVEETAPELEVRSVTEYVNPAFIRYITGSDYQ